MIYLTKELCEQALMGGLLLGGGGGGTLTAGREALEETFKHTDKLTMLDVSELKPDDVVVNVSTLGAPSAMGVHLSAEHWMTALKNFELNYGKKSQALPPVKTEPSPQPTAGLSPLSPAFLWWMRPATDGPIPPEPWEASD